MKCPKCGNEIKEGHLYCDVCGEEIRIVPDFDATVDDNLKISLTGVIDTTGVLEEIQKVATKEIDKEFEKEATKEIDVKRKPQITDTLDVVDINQLEGKKQKPGYSTIIKALVLTGAICVVIAIIGIAINKKVNNLVSIDYQYEKAFEEFENEEYENSIKTLKRAESINEEDPRIKLLLADNYYMVEKYDESNAVLYVLADTYPDDPGISEKIIRNYEAKEDYQAINSFLSEKDNEELNDKYAEYLAEDVAFSLEEGTYDEIEVLQLSSNKECSIFYTLDGSPATKNSMIYTEPIELVAGENVINAIAINSKGIASNNIEKKYDIDFFVPQPPEINAVAGTINVPALIEAKCADYDLCYYTIDGDNPTLDDKVYQGPIATYIGSHTYKFAVISNKGVSSDVVSIDVSLELITLVDMDTAKNNLKNWLTTTGKDTGNYKYLCEQAYVYNNATYYIINEYSKTESDMEQTGNHYAVDVLTGLTFRAILNKSTGEYTLEALI